MRCGGSLSDIPETVEDSSRCSSWIWLLIASINYSRRCANKVGRGWEREKVQRAAKRYDDDGHNRVVGLRLLLLVADIMTAKALPSQTNIRQETIIVEVRGESTRSSASCEAGWMRSSMVLSAY